MKGRPVILIPVGRIVAYIWQAGLDPNAPANARAWIRVCARSRVDVYCKAAARVMNEAQGPLVFLHPNMGDHDITAELTRWKPGFTASDVDAVVGANLFPAPSLKSGTYTALDGQQREVVCGLPDERYTCRIVGLRFDTQFGPQNPARREEDGAIYSVRPGGAGPVTPAPGQPTSFSFLLPRPPAPERPD